MAAATGKKVFKVEWTVRLRTSDRVNEEHVRQGEMFKMDEVAALALYDQLIFTFGGSAIESRKMGRECPRMGWEDGLRMYSVAVSREGAV